MGTNELCNLKRVYATAGGHFDCYTGSWTSAFVKHMIAYVVMRRADWRRGVFNDIRFVPKNEIKLFAINDEKIYVCSHRLTDVSTRFRFTNDLTEDITRVMFITINL